MKNLAILKDELSILRADKSAVITELRLRSREITELSNQILKHEYKLEKVKNEILQDTARLDDTRSRAFSVKEELSIGIQELKNINNAIDLSKTKNSQEQRLHLGRIRELAEAEKELTIEISNLKSLFDRNSFTYNELESERKNKIKNIESEIVYLQEELEKTKSSLEKKKEEEDKFTQDRILKEEKSIMREKEIDNRELSLTRWEEDLLTMAKDMSIMYARLKEFYIKEKPGVDFDKVIKQAL